jgi:hypothetical protein
LQAEGDGHDDTVISMALAIEGANTSAYGGIHV